MKKFITEFKEGFTEGLINSYLRNAGINKSVIFIQEPIIDKPALYSYTDDVIVFCHPRIREHRSELGLGLFSYVSLLVQDLTYLIQFYGFKTA